MTWAKRWPAVLVVAVLAGALLVAFLVTRLDSLRSRPPAAAGRPGFATAAAFAWFRPGPAPTGWRHQTRPSGAATLSYPPSLAPVTGDADAVSVGRVDGNGHLVAYLNATPQQGDERLRGRAAFRVGVLRHDDARFARAEAATEGLSFRGGRGSCVLDDYVTRIGDNHFRELASLVEGPLGGGVLVAAAPVSNWGRFRGSLERAADSYLAR